MNAGFDKGLAFYIKGELDIVGVHRERLFAAMEICVCMRSGLAHRLLRGLEEFLCVDGRHDSIKPLQRKSVKRTADGVLRC